MDKLPQHYILTNEVAHALLHHHPIVALESTVITHGLPRPQNLSLAQDMERQVRQEGAAAATIALLDGKIHIGMSPAELSQLAADNDPLKVSTRDFARAILQRRNGGTTVAGTMFAAHQAGIRVFATGGIGGVHKGARFDVSTDLKALSEIPLIVVCSGAKSILDLSATLEYLETMGVPVVGYQVDKFPAFYSVSSDLPVGVRLDKIQDVVDFTHWHWSLGMRSAVLICQPVPALKQLAREEAEKAEKQASEEATAQKVSGQKVTPFLLKRVNELTDGRSMRANLALLLNNAQLAAQIARTWADKERSNTV
jgi:pseudouridine-5'-phosphate glycosidase